MEGANTQYAYLQSLPAEIILEVMSYLPLRDLCNISYSNSCFLALAQDDSLWRNFCISWGLKQQEGGPRFLWQERLKKVAQREAVKFEKVKKRISAKKPTLPRRGVVKWSRLIPGDMAVLAQRPCKLESVRTSQPNSHGSAKLLCMGKDMFTMKNYFASYPPREEPEQPKLEWKEFDVVDVDECESTVYLMNDFMEERTIPFPVEESKRKSLLSYWKEGGKEEKITTIKKRIK